MPRAPSARIQARRERAAQDNEDVAGRQVARPNRARLVNQRNPLHAPARANRHQEEEEVQQELVYDEGANYDDEEMDEDYMAEEEEESEQVELEPEDEEQELPEPPMNDLVAVMAQQTRLLEPSSRIDKDAVRTPTDQKPDPLNS